MKRRMIAAALACLACTAGLSACGGSASAENVYRIAVIIKHTDEHFKKVMAGAEACASEHPNVEIDIQSPTSATAYDKQLNMIETVLHNDGIDAVVLASLQSSSAAALAETADKPIIALDTDFTSDKKLSFVGTGNEAAAQAGGAVAMEKATANGADKPQAVILTGAQGDETHEARLRGYRSAVEQAGGTVLEVQYCDAQPDRAAAAMEAVMQKYPQGVDAVLVTSDDMALAAIKCIWDNNSAAYRKTVICGFDGNQAAVEALDRGELTVDIAQQGYEMGYRAVEAALDALEGKSVESVIDSGSEVITADNIDAYIADCREKGLWEYTKEEVSAETSSFFALKAFSMYHLIEQRIDNGRGYIRAALAASCDDIRRVPADEQLLRLDHVDKSDRHADDERRRDNAFLNQLMQTDKRSRRIADGEEERAFKFGGVLHRNDRPCDTASLGLACHLLVRHQADRLSAELCQRHLAHPGERHIGIGDHRCPCRKRGFCLFDHVRRKREAVRVVKIRRSVNDALDHLGDACRKRALAQLGGDDLKRPLFDVLRLHVSVQNSIPSRAAMPFSNGCRCIFISVM